MKRILLTMIALGCLVVAKAQTDFIGATLQTGDVVKVYHGSNALQNAYADAVDGSVITLTSGTFSSLTIQKNISIYGVGWEEDAANGVQPTILSGKLYIYSGSNDKNLEHVRVEGVYVKNNTVYVKQTTDLVISKCRFSSLEIYGTNAEAISVRQSYFSSVTGNSYVNGLDIQNCFVEGKNSYSNLETQIIFDHCIMRSYCEYGHSRATYTNCIFGAYYKNYIEGGSTVKNCIFPNGFSGLSNSVNANNWWLDDTGSVFSDAQTLDYSATRTFTLADPDLFVGTDGTQVGINGGNYPWNKIPATPLVKNMGVSVSGTTLKVSYQTEAR